MELVDHPGFRDPEYLARREVIAEISSSYKMGDSRMPDVDYTEKELATWSYAYQKLIPSLKVKACSEFN